MDQQLANLRAAALKSAEAKRRAEAGERSSSSAPVAANEPSQGHKGHDVPKAKMAETNTDALRVKDSSVANTDTREKEKEKGKEKERDKEKEKEKEKESERRREASAERQISLGTQISNVFPLETCGGFISLPVKALSSSKEEEGHVFQKPPKPVVTDDPIPKGIPLTLRPMGGKVFVDLTVEDSPAAEPSSWLDDDSELQHITDTEGMVNTHTHTHSAYIHKEKYPITLALIC